jgi:pSer/pThr/pTyr-binding forkhead associated (FHA) protein
VRARSDSGEATQYVSAPRIEQGRLAGVLVGISGQLEGEIHKVFERDMRVGRGDTSDIKLLDPKVSREHAKIVSVDGDLMIVPMTDKNPVYVNEHVVEEAEQLSDGDKLQLGNPGASVFRFRTIEGQ